MASLDSLLEKLRVEATAAAPPPPPKSPSRAAEVAHDADEGAVRDFDQRARWADVRHYAVPLNHMHSSALPCILHSSMCGILLFPSHAFFCMAVGLCCVGWGRWGGDGGALGKGKVKV